MDVLLANPRGFCAGVDRAIEIVERALETFGAPIYVRHEVVHNRYVVDKLRGQGAVFVDELEEVPDGATVIFSAHGVSQTVRGEASTRGLRVFDATCPLVTKVHMEVARHGKAGRDVILIGHAGHPEVEGTMGQWDAANAGTIHLVETPECVERIVPRDPAQLAFVTQTTLSVDDTKAVIEALQKRFPAIVGPRHDDICYATQNRQDAVRRLGQECDLVLVVGSPNSSNSNRLRELAEKQGVPALPDRRRRRHPPRVDRRPPPCRRDGRRIGARKPRARGARAPARVGRDRRCASSTASPRTSRSRCRRNCGCASSPEPGPCGGLPLVREILPSTQTRLVPQTVRALPCGCLFHAPHRGSDDRHGKTSEQSAVARLQLAGAVHRRRRARDSDRGRDAERDRARAAHDHYRAQQRSRRRADRRKIRGGQARLRGWRRPRSVAATTGRPGWQVYVDSDNDGQLTGTDTILGSYAALDDNYTVKTKVTNGASDALVLFSAQGSLATPATQVDINVCRPDGQTAQSAWIHVSASGEIISQRNTSSSNDLAPGC